MVPVQVSGRSHVPAAGLQVEVDDLKLLAGHGADVPSHFSATSHPPDAAALQMVPNAFGLWVQAPLEQISSVHALESSHWLLLVQGAADAV